MYNNAILTEYVWRDIVRHMISQETEEVCGLLAGLFSEPYDGGEESGCIIHEFKPIDNVNPDPEGLFVMDPKQQLDYYQDVHARNLHIVGCVHSHPHGLGIPSEIDRQGINEDYLWLIWGHLDNTLRAWWPVVKEKRFKGVIVNS